MRAHPERRAVAMPDEATARVQLRAILQLIDRAVSALADDESSIGLACASQAHAARAALQHVVANPSPLVGGQTGRATGARIRDTHDEVVLLLAAAERQLAAVSAEARNQLPVCAAAAYLRRARQALARP
jgi:hypothetical protein